MRVETSQTALLPSVATNALAELGDVFAALLAMIAGAAAPAPEAQAEAAGEAGALLAVAPRPEAPGIHMVPSDDGGPHTTPVVRDALPSETRASDVEVPQDVDVVAKGDEPIVVVRAGVGGGVEASPSDARASDVVTISIEPMRLPDMGESWAQAPTDVTAASADPVDAVLDAEAVREHVVRETTQLRLDVPSDDAEGGGAALHVKVHGAEVQAAIVTTDERLASALIAERMQADAAIARVDLQLARLAVDVGSHEHGAGARHADDGSPARIGVIAESPSPDDDPQPPATRGLSVRV